MTLLPRALAFAPVLLLACGMPEPPAALTEPSVRELRLEALPQESPEHGLFGEPFTHFGLIDRIEKLAKDDKARGIVLRAGPLEGAFARSAELTRALQAFAKSGKPVHCHFETADNTGFMVLARACSRISMAPGGILDLVGVATEAVYAAELLKTAGLRAELIQIGRYKGAADPLTRDSMPPEVRETTEALISDLHGGLVAAIAEGRKLDPASVQAIIDQGPFTAEQARAHKLIDDVAFDDEARTHAKEAAKVDRVDVEQLHATQTELSLFDLIAALSGEGPAAPPSGDRIALAYLDGTILTGTEEAEQSAHSAPFVKELRRLGDLPEVKAVVVRIDSPGGSALASDAMWHAVRRVVKRKPVIVSIGDLAASGGYYVASAGTKILADDASVVGSIGVVGGKIVGEELTARLGVHSERIARGKRAGWTSSLRAFSEDERAAVTGLLEATYALFLDRIAEGRNLPKERILPLAEGRIMSGKRAREGGLVDQQGGLTEALALARSMGKVADEAQVEVWPPQRNLLDQIAQMAGGPGARAGASAVLPQLLPRALSQGLPAALIASDDLRLAVLPFALTFR